MFLDNIELRIENKNFSLEKNCFVILVSDLYKKWLNDFEKKVQRTNKKSKR